MEKRFISRWVIGSFLAMVCFLVAALVLKGVGLLPPGSGSSTQTGSDVLVTSASAISNTGEVTLFNRSIGRQIWQKQTPVNDLTPVSANGLVFVVAENPWGSSPDRTDTLEALSLASGQQIWSWSWHMHMTTENPPIISNGVIYLSESTLPNNVSSSPAPNSEYQGFVIALQASDGQQLWKDSLAGELSPPTIAADGTVYVSNGTVVLALSSNDGHQRWQYAPHPTDSLSYYAQPLPQRESYVIVAQGQQVYLILRYVDGGHWSADLVALNNQNGQGEWRYQTHTEMSTDPFLLFKGVIYLTYDMFPGDSFLVALNAANGSVFWTYRQAGQYSQSQPLIVDDVLYMSENATQSKETSDVVALHISDGSVVHRYGFPNGTGVGAPVVSQNTLYLGVNAATSSGKSTITVATFDLETGREIWSSKLSQQFAGLTVIVSQGQVYAYSPWDYTPDTLVVFQAGNGQQEWAYPTTGWIYHVVTDVG